MGSTPSSEEVRKTLTGRKTVVIIGGGYGGVQLAQELDEHLNVILIDRNNYKFHNVGALRACVEPEFVKGIIIPYNRFLKYGIVIYGEVVAMNAKSVTVEASGDASKSFTIPFDYCVLAIGTNYAFPSKSGIRDEKEVPNEYKQVSEAIAKASHVVIVGAGPVGLELMGEIAHTYDADLRKGKKKLTLLNGSDKLFSRYAFVNDRFRTKLMSKLKSEFPNLELRFGETYVAEDHDNKKEKEKEKENEKENETTKVETETKTETETTEKNTTTTTTTTEEKKEEDESAPSSSKGETRRERRYIEGKQVIKTSKGAEIECDLIFFCNGASVNQIKDQSFIQGIINKENGRIRVKKTLQIRRENCDHIYALGDCADNAAQFAYLAGEQAKLVAHNIRADSRGQKNEIKEYSVGMQVVVLTLGKDKGVSQLPGPTVFGSRVTSTLKGKTMLCEKSWKQAGYEDVPPKVLFYDDPAISLKDNYLSKETLARFKDKTGLEQNDLIGLITGKWPSEATTTTTTTTTTEKEEKTAEDTKA